MSFLITVTILRFLLSCYHMLSLLNRNEQKKVSHCFDSGILILEILINNKQFNPIHIKFDDFQFFSKNRSISKNVWCKAGKPGTSD